MLIRIVCLISSVIIACNGFAAKPILAVDKVLLGDASKANVETCVACHAKDGNSLNPIWPKLAGQHVIYLVKQMKEFKLGEKGPRYNASMLPMVAALNETDMINIATYFSKQKISTGKADPKLVERGQQLYRGGDLKRGISACAACHGPRGEGNLLAKFPAVGSQHAAYTEEQLEHFRSGKRRNGPMMTAIAKRMSDEDIKAVSSYIAGLY